MDQIWFKAYTVYQKDPRILDEWLKVVEEDPIKALETARKLTVAEVIPDTLTLGFSPQILVAILAVNYPSPVNVITSPEVAQGTYPAARHSYKTLKVYSEVGLISQITITPMTPTEQFTPKQVIEEVKRTIEKIRPQILDISGGTQLVAIAAVQAKIKLTYTYPQGKQVKIYTIT